MLLFKTNSSFASFKKEAEVMNLSQLKNRPQSAVIKKIKNIEIEISNLLIFKKIIFNYDLIYL